MPRGSFVCSEVEVEGSRGDTYYVQMAGDMPISCNCPHYEYRAGPAGRSCKHMTARAGRRAIGVTRCSLCSAWLTPGEIKSQPELEENDPCGGSRVCAGCRPVL